jgi:hypothetical protein
MHPLRGRQVPPNKFSDAVPNGRRKMIKLPKSRNPPCAPATGSETMAGRCAMAQGPWLKDGRLALLLMVPE